jgi:hypothetical protein
MSEAARARNCSMLSLQRLFALLAKMPFDAGVSGVSWDNPQEDFHGAEV